MNQVKSYESAWFLEVIAQKAYFDPSDGVLYNSFGNDRNY